LAEPAREFRMEAEWRTGARIPGRHHSRPISAAGREMPDDLRPFAPVPDDPGETWEPAPEPAWRGVAYPPYSPVRPGGALEARDGALGGSTQVDDDGQTPCRGVLRRCARRRP
jgi:hypothetical protein